jgi:hypothetical protein
LERGGVGRGGEDRWLRGRAGTSGEASSSTDGAARAAAERAEIAQAIERSTTVVMPATMAMRGHPRYG